MIDEVIGCWPGSTFGRGHGASGCGKSSLSARRRSAWLALDHAAAGVPWRTAIGAPAGGPPCATSRPSSAGRWARPRAGRRRSGATAWPTACALGRVGLCRTPGRSAPADASLCLLRRSVRGAIPLGAGHNREEARLVAELLRLGLPTGAVPRGSLFVILTMRSDYLGACCRLRRLRRKGQPLPVPPAAHGRFRACCVRSTSQRHYSVEL